MFGNNIELAYIGVNNVKDILHGKPFELSYFVASLIDLWHLLLANAFPFSVTFSSSLIADIHAVKDTPMHGLYVKSSRRNNAEVTKLQKFVE